MPHRHAHKKRHHRPKEPHELPLTEGPVHLANCRLLSLGKSTFFVISASTKRSDRFFLLDHETCSRFAFSLRKAVGSVNDVFMSQKDLISVSDALSRVIDFTKVKAAIHSFGYLDENGALPVLERCIRTYLSMNPSAAERLKEYVSSGKKAGVNTPSAQSDSQ